MLFEFLASTVLTRTLANEEGDEVARFSELFSTIVVFWQTVYLLYSRRGTTTNANLASSNLGAELLAHTRESRDAFVSVPRPSFGRRIFLPR